MRFEVTAAIAVAATGVIAQSSESFSTLTASNSSIAPMVVTMTIDDCESSSMPTMITVTNGVTITYCPECEMASSESAAMASSTSMIPHTTIYTTTYMSLCSTGATWYTTPQEYTVTESCTEATPTWSTGTDHVPQGFTTTEMMCSMCGETPMPMTITMPCGCEETEGAGSPSGAAASATAPAGSGSSGSEGSAGSAAPGGIAAPAGSAAPSGSVAPTGSAAVTESATPGIESAAPGTSAATDTDSGVSAATGSGAGASTAPYPTPAAASTSMACPGPGCRAAQPSASPVSSNSVASPSQSLEAFTGVASSFKTSGWSISGGMFALAVFFGAVLL